MLEVVLLGLISNIYNCKISLCVFDISQLALTALTEGTDLGGKILLYYSM
jgi:hypothetical protein